MPSRHSTLALAACLLAACGGGGMASHQDAGLQADRAIGSPDTPMVHDAGPPSDAGADVVAGHDAAMGVDRQVAVDLPTGTDAPTGADVVTGDDVTADLLGDAVVLDVPTTDLVTDLAGLDTADAGVAVLASCLDRPTDLLRPPSGQLSCDLIPPSF